VRKFAFFCIVALAPVLVPAAAYAAFTYEVHPGIYNSYEYTDNYYGEVREGRSEGTYLVGPSLEVTAASPTINLGFTGRYTKSFHRRFSEDDSPEVHLSSEATHTAPRRVSRLTYTFTRTLTRENLSEPFGDARIHTGDISFSWELTQQTSLQLGYDVTAERRTGETSAEEDVTSHTGNLGCTYAMSPVSRVSMTVQQVRHDYEESDNVIETGGTLSGEHDVSPVLTLGVVSTYNHENRGDLPDEDRYDARLTGRHVFPGEITLGMEGGGRWLVMEDQDRESGFAGSASLAKVLEHDRLNLRVAKEYSSEFTTNRYGTYDTTSVDFDWYRDISRGFSSTARFSLEKRRPVGGTVDEEQTDGTGGLSISWNPVENITLSWDPVESILVTLSYDHLRTKYETSGTARENRYRVMVEVRY